MKKMILIVDDSVTIRKIIVDSLHKDYDCLEAENGVVALELLKKHKVNVVITDYKMPIMDGLEFIKKAKAITKFVPFVLLTSEEDETAIRLLKNSGAATYLHKPIKTDMLRKIIRAIG